MAVSATNPTYAEAVLADAPVAWWRCNDTGAVMADSSAGRVTRSLVGNPVPIDLSGNFCTQPGMCQTGDTAIIVYSGQPSQLGSAADLYIVTSTNGGDTWTAPAQLVTGFEASNVLLGSCGLVALGDGSVVLTFGYYNGAGGYFNYSMRSTNAGATWSTPVVIPVTGFGYKGTLGCSNPTLLPNGTVLRTIYGSDGAAAWNSGVGTYIRICRSTDNGKTWADMGVTISLGPENQSLGGEQFSPNESTIVPTNDGRLMLCARVDAGYGGSQVYVYTCYSSDNGETWTLLQPKIMGNYAVPASILTPNGEIWVAGRTHGPNAAAYAEAISAPGFAVGSADNGETWGNVTPILVPAPTATVNGPGQVISGTPSSLTVSPSTAAFPATGQATVAGVTGVVSYTGKTLTQLTGCTIPTGSYTATNGGAVALVAYTEWNYGALAYIGGSLGCAFGEGTFPSSNGGLYFWRLSTSTPDFGTPLALSGSYAQSQPSPLKKASSAASTLFEGTGDAVGPIGPSSVPTVTNDMLMAIALGSYSIEMWMNPADLLASYWAVGFAYGSVTDPHVIFDAGTILASGSISYGGGGLPAGVWYHVVFVVNGNTTQLYVNGGLVATANTPPSTVTGTSPYVAKGVAGNANFKGNLAEIAFYSGPLAPARTLAHYQAAVAGDAPTLENGLVRVRYDTSTTPGFRVDVWNGSAYVEQGKITVARIGDVTGYCDTSVSAGLYEYTPDRAIMQVVLANSADAYSRERVFITVQRGEVGATFECYPALKADGVSQADAQFVYTPNGPDANDSIMFEPSTAQPPSAATDLIWGTASSNWTSASGTFSSSTSNYVAILRSQGGATTVGPYQATLTVVQQSTTFAGVSDTSGYGSSENAVQISGAGGMGYLQVGLGFTATQPDQVQGSTSSWTSSQASQYRVFGLASGTWTDYGEMTGSPVSTGSSSRVEVYLTQDRTRNGAIWNGCRDQAQTALYDSRTLGALVAR